MPEDKTSKPKPVPFRFVLYIMAMVYETRREKRRPTFRRDRSLNMIIPPEGNGAKLTTQVHAASARTKKRPCGPHKVMDVSGVGPARKPAIYTCSK